jgi:hypothetical protein
MTEERGLWMMARVMTMSDILCVSKGANFWHSLKLKQDSVERKNEFDSISKFPSHDLRFPVRVHDVENRIPAPISLQPPFCPFPLIFAPFPPFFGSSSR